MESTEWLANVVARIDAYPTRAHAIYVKGEHPLEVRTPTMVLERDVYSDELPDLARKHGLRYVLSVADVLGIVSNARRQRADVSATELVEAVNFYLKHDAFIDFERRVRGE
ncbi:DUF7716 domain-containing protein [Corallococcus silvisoli]|uniref:DUF7716 domain-containing protein n=1 Tax=Corallococcus silvisoli TaxID=2697031 RepID=UPI0013780335|nr:hypothetical protein [Corallococcus silvisoli]NBD13826.1 hypothetical protein [Corallococcus silvisoli]